MFYERNQVLTKLEEKKIPLGIQCFTANTELVEVMGATGFDFVMFDCGHSGNDVGGDRGTGPHGDHTSNTKQFLRTLPRMIRFISLNLSRV